MRLFPIKSNLRSLLCLLIGLSVAFTAFDYKRVRQGEAPLFVIPTASFKDGGSVQLSGLGYSVKKHHEVFRIRVEKDETDWAQTIKGYSFKHWFLPISTEMLHSEGLKETETLY